VRHRDTSVDLRWAFIKRYARHMLVKVLSYLAITVALALLAAAAIMLALDRQDMANRAATYAFCSLVAAVLLGLIASYVTGGQEADREGQERGALPTRKYERPRPRPLMFDRRVEKPRKRRDHEWRPRIR